MGWPEGLTYGDSKDSSHDGVCAHCFGSATQACKGCINSPVVDGHSPVATFYCNSTCQKANWLHHKKVCKSLSSRKQLYRAGDLIQHTFYAYREQAFEKFITKVEKEGNTLYLYEGQYGEGQVLAPFPGHLFACEDDKNAALTYLACTDAVSFMLDLVKSSLKGKHQRLRPEVSS